jgi:hypothetical protein
MTPYVSTGRNGRHFYYGCTKRQHGYKEDCDAPYVPAELLDKAVIERCIALSVDEQARDRIVRAAMERANDEGKKVDGEIDAVRHQMGRIKTQIVNLLDVLKQLGATGIGSVKDELESLEAEQRRLGEELKRLKKQRSETAGVTEKGRQFLDNWRNVAQLFDHATPEEQRALARLYVEVIEIRQTDPKKKAGSYAMVLFPEAVVDRPNPAEANARHNDDEPAEAGPLLRDGALVRGAPQKAPRPEDSEHRLLVEVGSWKIRNLRRDRRLEIHPWTPPETLRSGPQKRPVVKQSPAARARFYQNLIDSGVVKNKAELARTLGLSRARITQIMRHINKQ